MGIIVSLVNSALHLSEPFYYILSGENGTPAKEKRLQEVGGCAGTGSAVLCEPTLGLSLEPGSGEVGCRRGGRRQARRNLIRGCT